MRKIILFTLFLFTLCLGIFVLLRGIPSFISVFLPQTFSLQHDENGHTNILLLGVGGAGHSGADLTDTMMIASLDAASSPSVVLLSLPRDIMLLDEKGYATGRINALYHDYLRTYLNRERLAPELASRHALEDLSADIGAKLGISIHYYIKGDFSAFVQAVDAVGGIDIDVKEHIVDPFFPLEEGKVGLYEIAKGVHHMTGEEALRYARSRHSSTDFDRSSRQQDILQAFVEKVKSTKIFFHPQTFLSVWNALSSSIETNFQTSELLGLSRVLSRLPHSHILSRQINFFAGGESAPLAGGFVYSAPMSRFGSAAVLLPLPLSRSRDDWVQIKAFTNLLFSFRQLFFQPASLEIQNMSASALESRQLFYELKRYGFNVSQRHFLRGAFAPSFALTKSSLCTSDTKSHDTQALLQSLTSLPFDCPLQTTTGAQLTFFLGSDYRFSPFAFSILSSK